MATRSDGLKKLLTDMTHLPDVSGAALISRDGIGALQELPAGAEHASFCAMAAAMLGAAEAALLQIGRGTPHRMIVDSSDSRLLVQGLTAELLLVVIAQPSTNLSSLEPSIRAVAEQAKTMQ